MSSSRPFPNACLIAAPLGELADPAALPPAEPFALDQRFQQVVVGTGWTMKTVESDTTGEMQNHLVGLNIGAFSEPFEEIAQLAERGLATTPAARHGEKVVLSGR